MTEIYTYSVAILVGVGVFGAILGLMRLLHTRRLGLARGVIRNLETTALRDLEKKDLPEKDLREGEPCAARPSLFGIPYVAWISTSLFIPSAFLILFIPNLARVNPGQLLGTLLILSVFIFILLYHINILYPTGTEKNKNLVLIYVMILSVLACAKMALFYELFSPYLIPLPWAGMVITVLVNRRIVPLTMFITLIFVSLLAPFDFGLFLVLLAGGLVSGGWVRKARKRYDLMFASLLVGLVMALVFVCQSLLNNHQLSLVLPEAVASLSNGLMAGLLTLIFLPAFELLFDFASPFRLSELLDLNSPVLSELFLKAPGTYHHSMAVATISEKVANDIGANGLLVRVGAYHHDIGKMFNPQYFIENQVGGKDQHDELGPVASAAVIRSHVILGVRLARKIGLPGPVEAFIPEHHGTSTIHYFYNKSKRLESQIKSERVFKYSGPKPQSKETGIVMIVDSCEAAFRVIEKGDKEAIRKIVSRIAYGKAERGELDESGLTTGDLKKIIDVLTDFLESSVHRRIAYPSDEESRAEGSHQSSLRIVSQGGASKPDP